MIYRHRHSTYSPVSNLTLIVFTTKQNKTKQNKRLDPMSVFIYVWVNRVKGQRSMITGSLCVKAGIDLQLDTCPLTDLSTLLLLLQGTGFDNVRHRLGLATLLTLLTALFTASWVRHASAANPPHRLMPSQGTSNLRQRKNNNDMITKI